MTGRDVSKVPRAAYPVTVLHATAAALWHDARHACDDALARGFTFVLVLNGAEALGDDSLLMDEDRRRSARFHRPSDRRNFVLGRTMVHHLVRSRGASTPYAFRLGLYGKPFLPNAPAFSLSHSGRWIACAVSRHDPVGIDLETFTRLGDYRDLLPAVAHPAERRCIGEAMPHERLPLFQRCWARKEAILKATGVGLTDDLQSIDVRLDQDGPLLSDPAPLRVIDLPLNDGQVTAALAQAPCVQATVVMRVDRVDRVSDTKFSASRASIASCDLPNSRSAGSTPSMIVQEGGYHIETLAANAGAFFTGFGSRRG